MPSRSSTRPDFRLHALALSLLTRSAWALNGCTPGNFESVPSTGCVPATLGHYVPAPDATAETAAAAGQYVDVIGATAPSTVLYGYLTGVSAAVDEAMLDDGAAGASRPTLSVGGQTLQIVDDLTSSRSIDIAAGVGSINTGTHTATLNGTVSGAGILQKAGTGTLVLGGSNTYTGLTRIPAGVLSIAADAALGIAPVSATAGHVVLSGGSLSASTSFTLNANRGIAIGNGAPGAGIGIIEASSGATLSYAGIIADNGATTATLNKAGAGTLVLSGSNAYTGTTNILSGTLQLGNGGTTGSINGADITNDGVLRIERSNAYALSNTISGTGALVQAGSGTTTVSGINTYSGSTTISAGVLSIAADDALGSAPGAASAGHLKLTGGTLGISTSFTLNANRGIALGTGAAGVSGGTLDVSTGSTLNYGGTIDDNGASTGTLAKTGAGTLLLTGTNAYAGTTTITAGTLQVGAGGATGSLGSGDIVNEATLRINRDNTTSMVVANAISGNGDLVHAGTGTLILSGANTYAGNTDINTGTLQLGNGGTTGSAGTGAIANNGTLRIDRSDALSLSNTISGTGALVQTGSGTTTLSGPNTYSGSTKVSAGMLSIASDSALGSAPGAATANHLTLAGGTLRASTTFTLHANRGIALGTGAAGTSGGTLEVSAGTLTYAGTIQDNGASTGALNKTGSGTLILSGTNSYSGATTVTQGTLRINGSLAGATSIATGATLGGTGTVGALTASGTVAPGNSIGTLTVAGNYLPSAGSELTIEFDDAGNSDQLAVTGSATLNGTLRYQPQIGNYTTPMTYTVLTAGGGVTGQFVTQIVDNEIRLGGLTVSTTYGANVVAATLVSIPYARNASGDTQELAEALEAVRATATGDLGTIIGVLTTLPAADVPLALSAFDARLATLAGRIDQQIGQGVTGTVRQRLLLAGTSAPHPGAFMLAAASSATMPDVTAPLRSARDAGYGSWLQVQGVSGEYDTRGTMIGADYTAGMLTLGHDLRLNASTVLGGALTLATGDTDYDLSRGSASADSARFDLYAERQGATWTVQLLGGVGYTSVDQSRAIHVGAIDRTATSEFDRFNVGAGVRVLRPIARDAHWTFAPNAAASVAYARQSGYEERGADSLNLSVNGLNNVYLTAELGLDAWRELSMGNATIRPYFGAGVRQQWTLGDDHITQSLVNVGSFSVPTYGDSSTLLFARMGADAQISARSRAYMNLSTAQGSDERDYRLMLGMRIDW